MQADCSPSRCALQSGRNPIHVNVLNNDIRAHNPADTVGGFQGLVWRASPAKYTHRAP
jgi:arylsulfatase A-like enzyme